MEQNLKMVRARTEVFNIALTDENGQPYVLTGNQKMIFGVKKDFADGNYMLKKEITSADATDNEGEYVLSIAAADTANVAWGKFFYDIGLQDGDNYYNVIEPSRFDIQPNVTKKGE